MGGRFLVILAAWRRQSVAAAAMLVAAMAAVGMAANVGDYIGGKKHKPPFPPSRWSKMGLTLRPPQYCVSNGLNFRPTFSVGFWG